MEGGKVDGMETFAVGDITDVQNGRNMMITKKVNPKNKKETEYSATASPQVSALPNAEAFCNLLNNLDEFVMRDYVTYEQMKAAIEGTEEPAQPTPSGAAPAPAPAPAAKPSGALARLQAMNAQKAANK